MKKQFIFLTAISIAVLLLITGCQQSLLAGQASKTEITDCNKNLACKTLFNSCNQDSGCGQKYNSCTTDCKKQNNPPGCIKACLYTYNICSGGCYDQAITSWKASQQQPSSELSTIKWGDINGDGKVNTQDLQCYALAAQDQNAVCKKQSLTNADLDCDGSITSKDQEMVAKIMLGQSLPTDGNKNGIPDCKENLVSTSKCNDVWAGAGYLGKTLSGELFHYDGVKWDNGKPTYQSSLEGIYRGTVSDIFGTSKNDIWVSELGLPTAIFHYDGTVWLKVSLPKSVGNGGGGGLYGLWGSSPNDVWAVGSGDGSLAYASKTKTPIIYHYDGATWSESFFTDSPTGYSSTLKDVYGSSADNVWAVGGSHVVHYEGSVWNNQDMDKLLDLKSVWVSSDGEVWVVGDKMFQNGASHTGWILHYDGTKWTEEGLDVDNLNGVWGTSKDNIWAVGGAYYYGTGKIFHYDGLKWTEQKSDVPILYGIWGSSANDIWAVGNLGVALHYDGKTWEVSKAPSIDGGQFSSVWGSCKS